MEIQVPAFSMVLMLGPTSSGKTTFAHKHFQDTEIIASDNCRAMVADDPNSQSATIDAFDLLHFILRARLKNRKLTVVDATNLQPRHRRTLLEIAREHDCPTAVIIMNTPLNACIHRSKSRTNRGVDERVIRNQHRLLRQSTHQLRKEGFRRSYVIDSPEETDTTVIIRTKPTLDQTGDSGPFDIIGDVHGCHLELTALLQKLGYEDRSGVPTHPDGRKAVFLGDLVDRGPASDLVLETVMAMTGAGTALAVTGNHDNKLVRALKGNNVQLTHGLPETLAQLENRTQEFKDKVQHFLSRLPDHYLLDQGNLAVAHAGVLEEYQGRSSRRIRSFCLYGQTTGETDEWGMPERVNWALEYRGKTAVVYGHVAVTQARWTNNTINVDTGCCFGGSLTALRYPERELVSVEALETYYEPEKPLTKHQTPEDQQDQPNPIRLNIADVTGRQQIITRTHGTIRVSEQQTASALETMSRFAMDPRWLVYLPPTISPPIASNLPELLEHPAQAFQQYQEDGIGAVICEEKHMGSRAIIVLGRDQDSITRKFGITDPNAGTCYSRTGRRFFTDAATETLFLNRAREAVGAAQLWEDLNTDWIIMDAEVMPWSLKAQGLLRTVYAPTATAALNTLAKAHELFNQAQARGIDTSEHAQNVALRLSAATSYRDAYRRYCWETQSLENVKAAPFHFMASEGQLLTDRPHTWHMETAARLQEADPELFQATGYRVISLDDEQAVQETTQWWENITSNGSEGMVVKPIDFVPNGKHGHVQPALKVRGPEYLRIIYGPEYKLPNNIERLRRRSLRTKRTLALKEFSLGIEGLQRFVDDEPLHRVHQCAFAVMALESEEVDPRL